MPVFLCNKAIGLTTPTIERLLALAVDMRREDAVVLLDTPAEVCYER